MMSVSTEWTLTTANRPPTMSEHAENEKYCIINFTEVDKHEEQDTEFGGNIKSN